MGRGQIQRGHRRVRRAKTVTEPVHGQHADPIGLRMGDPGIAADLLLALRNADSADLKLWLPLWGGRLRPPVPDPRHDYSPEPGRGVDVVKGREAADRPQSIARAAGRRVAIL